MFVVEYERVSLFKKSEATVNLTVFPEETA